MTAILQGLRAAVQILDATPPLSRGVEPATQKNPAGQTMSMGAAPLLYAARSQEQAPPTSTGTEKTGRPYTWAGNRLTLASPERAPGGLINIRA